MDQTTQFILFIPVLLFSVVAHEYAHGYAALKQGDTTALQLGRLTFNPLKHIDPVMTLLLPALLFFSSGGRFLFGGAKPVPVNPRNYRSFKRGDIIVSMAGIVTNVVLAFVCAILIVLTGLVGGASESISGTIGLFQRMLILGIRINLVLAMFNLLPIPPLDGSHVMKYILPPAWAVQYNAIGGAGFFILIGLLWFAPGVITFWMTPADFLYDMLLFNVSSYVLPYSLP